jgi:hypothetical protein
MHTADLPTIKRKLIVDTVQYGHRDLVVRWIAVLLWESLDDPFAMVEAIIRDGISLHDADGGAGIMTRRSPKDPLVSL